MKETEQKNATLKSKPDDANTNLPEEYQNATFDDYNNQLEEIEKGKKESLKYTIGDLEPASVIKEEYVTNASKETSELVEIYEYIRRMRKDGNCFYRGFTLCVFERMLLDKEFAKIMHKTFQDSTIAVIKSGMEKDVIDFFHDTLMDTSTKIINNKLSHDNLVSLMRNEQECNAIVWYMRAITSAHLQLHESDFAPYLPFEQPMSSYCRQFVEPTQVEADNIHIMALTQALNVAVQVNYIDSRVSYRVKIPDHCDSVVAHFLYRPGHYDVVYLSRKT